MKAFKLILTALAATVALAVACTKEITPPNFENDKVNPAAESSRVIAVSFGTQTKTYLDKDGLQPRFEDGKDTVLISNTNALDTCVVSVDDKTKVATISTDLTGPLTAVYPYKAAGMSDSNPKQIDTVLVSTVQSGEFADANICMAKMKGGNDESLSFENKTALFCIYPQTDNPEYVEVSAKNFGIANDYPTGSEYRSLDTIHVATTNADSVWVSILVPSGLKVSDLTFSDGTNVKAILAGDPADREIAVNTLYTVTKENWEREWISLGVGEFFDYLALNTDESYGIAKCTILQSPDGTQRYRIVNPYADKAQRSAAWGEDCAQATPSDYIEFWVTDEETMSITWDSFWLTGLWYGGVSGQDIKAYTPSLLSSLGQTDGFFVEEKVVHFTPYYYVDGLGGFGCYDCYLSMPGGPNLEDWLDTNFSSPL